MNDGIKYALLGVIIAASLYATYLALLVNAASPQVIGMYAVVSLGALVLARIAPIWAGPVKWLWVALSFVVIFAVVSGPLNYLRFN